jgi:hypothetical protein
MNNNDNVLEVFEESLRKYGSVYRSLAENDGSAIGENDPIDDEENEYRKELYEDLQGEDL